jgi:hypothetical protein
MPEGLKRHLDRAGWPKPTFKTMAGEAYEGLHELEDQVIAALLCYLAPLRDAGAAGHDDPLGSPDAVRHVLLEGMNGTAKTRLAKQVNRAILGPVLRALYRLCPDLEELVRSQGSPELSPSDLVGADSLATDERGMQALRFNPGPLLRNYLAFYADELNRSPPKTQSVLLEAMAEGQVTINTQDPTCVHRLRRLKDFFLIASQNPERHIGTFPLPEAQLDRFMIRLFMPYSGELEKIISVKPLGGGAAAGAAVTGGNGTLADAIMGPSGLDGQPYHEHLRKAFLDVLQALDTRRHQAEERLKSYQNEVAANVSRRVRQDIQVHQMKVEEQALAKTARLTDRLKNVVNDSDPDGFAAALAQRLCEDTPGSDEFCEFVEGVLMAHRRRELRAMRIEVAGLEVPPTVVSRTAALVYATWSRRAAAETVEGLERRLDGNERVQQIASEFSHGSSVRGAEALRDLAQALAWASGSPEVRIAHVDLVAPLVLNHRVGLVTPRPQGWYTRERVRDLVREVIAPPAGHRARARED